MKNPILKKVLPHLIAVIVFLIVSFFFCKPVLDGNVLNQSDIIGWKGSAQNAFAYKTQHGHFPLWNPSLFGGMPNYQIAMEGKSVLPPFTNILLFGLPKPVNFFFLACICFYILCLVLRTRPIVAMIGGLAYAFATYDPIIIGVGHESKMFAIALMPLLLAGIICTFEKKYWLGLALSTFGAFLEISVNHPQINFYFLLIAAAVSIGYIYTWIKNREWKHMAIAGGITAVSVIIGIAGCSLTLLTTYEYSKFTMRGGKDIAIEGDKVTTKKTTGLDTSYAFQYSLNKPEVVTLIMPGAFGGHAGKTYDENSSVVKKLVSRGAPENNAIEIASSLPKFWGEPDSTAGGPLYAGAIICILAVIGFVLYKRPLRWALLAVSVLAVMMAWGRYLPQFNTFLFTHLPMYNKFRSPSITMVITQFTIPLAAMLGLQLILFRPRSQELLKTDFKKILYAVGGLLAILTLMYLMMDYGSSVDQQILANKWDSSGSDDIGRLIVSGLKADRQSMFGGQLLRTFGFAIFVLGVLYLYLRNIIKPMVVAIVFLVVSTADLLIIDKEYLGDDKYVSSEELTTQNFSPTAIDQQILQDKDPDYRVFNMAAPEGTYNDGRTSYFHKSVGGYHPAKIRIYQDVIEKYLSSRPDPGILNMLNTKYIIVADPKSGQPQLMPNPDAFGPCWLVKHVKVVDGPAEAILALGNTNLKDTAIVEKTFANAIQQPQWDSTSSIKLKTFDNDAIDYEVNANGPQFAVFSEVYYPKGWNAYIDGKKVDYCDANYILRGLSIPTGKHAIRFVFEPATYKKGITLAYIASILILLFFVGGLFMAWRETKKKAEAAS